MLCAVELLEAWPAISKGVGGNDDDDDDDDDEATIIKTVIVLIQISITRRKETKCSANLVMTRNLFALLLELGACMYYVF